MRSPYLEWWVGVMSDSRLWAACLVTPRAWAIRAHDHPWPRAEPTASRSMLSARRGQRLGGIGRDGDVVQVDHASTLIDVRALVSKG
jgi:hypothetical protein